MKTAYQPSFLKDLKGLKGTPAYTRVKALTLETFPKAATLEAIHGVKRLKGVGSFYRVRVGDYRVGFSYDGDTVTFRRVLHRKDIHRYFP